MLRGRDPVRVDGLHVPRIRLARASGVEALEIERALSISRWGIGLGAYAARRLGHERGAHDRSHARGPLAPRESVTFDDRRQPLGPEHLGAAWRSTRADRRSGPPAGAARPAASRARRRRRRTFNPARTGPSRPAPRYRRRGSAARCPPCRAPRSRCQLDHALESRGNLYELGHSVSSRVGTGREIGDRGRRPQREPLHGAGPARPRG